MPDLPARRHDTDVRHRLRNEFEKTMGYLGARSVPELGPHIFASLTH